MSIHIKDPNKYVHILYIIFYIEVYIYLYKGNITLYMVYNICNYSSVLVNLCIFIKGNITNHLHDMTLYIAIYIYTFRFAYSFQHGL